MIDCRNGEREAEDGRSVGCGLTKERWKPEVSLQKLRAARDSIWRLGRSWPFDCVTLVIWTPVAAPPPAEEVVSERSEECESCSDDVDDAAKVRWVDVVRTVERPRRSVGNGELAGRHGEWCRHHLRQVMRLLYLLLKIKRVSHVHFTWMVYEGTNVKAGIRKDGIEAGHCGVLELLRSEGDIDSLVPSLWHVSTILVDAQGQRA